MGTSACFTELIYPPTLTDIAGMTTLGFTLRTDGNEAFARAIFSGIILRIRGYMNYFRYHFLPHLHTERAELRLPTNPRGTSCMRPGRTLLLLGRAVQKTSVVPLER